MRRCWMIASCSGAGRLPHAALYGPTWPYMSICMASVWPCMAMCGHIKCFNVEMFPTCYITRLSLAIYRFALISLAIGSTNCNDKERIMKCRPQNMICFLQFYPQFHKRRVGRLDRFHMALPMKSIFQFSRNIYIFFYIYIFGRGVSF